MEKLFPWGNYPKSPQTAHFSYWRNDVFANLSKVINSHGSTLPFGNGRSYGDSCLAESDNVLYMKPLNRLISVDWENGIIIAEAGITLEEILSICIPHGWFLSVTPGTKYITLGGAIANDVHGKNHHIRGTFGCHVNKFGLIRSDNSHIICSIQENHELFAATIGGLGLTGIIDWVELKLLPIKSSVIDGTTIRFASLKEFFQLSEEFDSKNEYSVSWIDCLAKGSSTGRGIFMAGDFTVSGELEYSDKSKYTIPFTPPFSTINKLSIKIFNSAYYKLCKDGRTQKQLSYDPFFYPLDSILHWNRIYGSKGFQQYQCVIPDKNDEVAIKELLEIIASSGNGSFLAVMKKCGDIVSPGLMSFPMQGVTLALDFPQSKNLNKNLFPKLDKIVHRAGGRLYPAKDAHMQAEHFRDFYPNWEKIEKLRDPVLNSHFWKRVTEK